MTLRAGLVTYLALEAVDVGAQDLGDGCAAEGGAGVGYGAAAVILGPWAWVSVMWALGKEITTYSLLGRRRSQIPWESREEECR